MFIQAKHLPNLFEESLRSHRDALAQSTRWKTAFTLPISKRTVDFVVFFERMDGESGAPKNFCWESSVDATIDGATEQVAFASGCIEHLGKSGGDAIAIALQVFHPQIAREWSAFLVPVPVLPRSTSLVVKALEVEGQKWRESEAAAWMAASPSRVSKPK